MKSITNLLKCSLVLSGFIILSLSCNKENSSSDAQEQEVSMASSESDAEAEAVYNGIFDDVMGVNDDVGMAGTGIFGRASTNSSTETQRPFACFTVTVTPITTTSFFPVRVVIDFGPVACMGPDGHTRRGKIITEYSSRLIIPGAVATTHFENFYFDSIKVEGVHKVSNISNAANIPPSRAFKAEVINGKLTRPNGNYIEWNSTKTITQVEGLLTPDRPLDDVFKIEGTSRGKALRGNLLVTWKSHTMEPLIKRFICRWIVKGIIRTERANVTTNTQWVATLNYGNGNCDNRAVITINGVSHEITLR